MGRSWVVLSLLLFHAIIQQHPSQEAMTLDEFFPFGLEAGDTLMEPNDDGSVGPISLPHIFPYFDNTHRQIYQANNGLFSFLGPIRTYNPIEFPLGDDQRLITAFWADIDTRGNTGNLTVNHVYRQVYTRATSNSSNTTLLVFDKIISFVRQYFPRETIFNPLMVIVGTWYRVGYYSRFTDKLNTFQMALATDGSRSFVFFLYNELEWAGNSASGPYAQAGFNAGDGVNFKMLKYSRTSNITLLVNESNVNVPGLFAFRIDTTDIESGGCGENNTLTHWPVRGQQIGGTTVRLQGPCFSPNNSTILCHFGDFGTVNGLVLNEFQAVCVSPLAAYPTTVQLNVSIDGGETFTSWGTFTYLLTTNDVFAQEEIIIRKNGTSEMFISWNDTIELEWRFSETVLAELPADAFIEIDYEVIGTNEERTLQQQPTANSDVDIEVQEIVTVASNIRPQAGLQTITIDLSNITRVNPRIVPLIGIGVGVVRVGIVIHRAYKVYRAIKTAIKVIQKASEIGCNIWSDTQEDPSTWNEDLLPCPNTLRQANVARGQYEPDALCRQSGFPLVNCWFHRGRPEFNEENAAACFRSIQSNSHGAGAQCCYNDGGQIITRGTGAGTDDRYHSGQAFWKHQFHDVATFLACCKLQSNPDTCNDYIRLRPPRAGSDTRGQFGGTWGDPHFMTLDGTSYTFNGYGEYIYLAIPTEPSIIFDTNNVFQFESQIRTTPLENITNGVTVIKAFAARMNSITVSITVSRRNQLLVHVNNEEVTFISDPDTYFQSDTITLPLANFSITKNITSNQITLVSIVGVSIQVTPVFLNTTSALVLNVAAAVSGDLKGNWTLGLIGGYDGNGQNDFRIKNGTVIGTVETLSLRQIHELFGVTWAISPDRSLFYYEAHDNASFYGFQNLNYIPNFEDPAAISLQTNVLAACGIPLESTNASHWTSMQRTCYYDATMTGDLAFGVSSRQAAEEQLAYRESLLNPPRFNTELSLRQNVQAGKQVNLSFQATSEFSLIIVYKLLNGPNGSTLDEGSGQFQWNVPIQARNGSEYPIKVSATDGTKNLTSSYEILLLVEAKIDEQHTTAIIATTFSNTSSSTTTSSTTSFSTSSTRSTTTQTISVPVSTAATITAGSIISITLNTLSPKFRRIGGSSANYYYNIVLIAITQSGVYTFTSNSNIATHGFIYINNFDPENPGSNVLAEDYGSGDNGQYKISVFLQITSQVSKRSRMIRASTTYYLVTTTRDPEATGTISIKTDGPNTTRANSTSQNSDSGQGGKIAGIAIGSTLGGMLLISCCFTVCVLGVSSIFFCFKGTPFRSNKYYVSGTIGMYNDRNNISFRPGSYSSYYVKNGSLRGPYNLVLGFYPNGGHIVYGKGDDNVGKFVIKGVYSPKTLRMGLEKHYQKGTGDSNANFGHTMTVQLQWNNSTQNFEGKYYLKHGKHRDEQRYIIRPNHASYGPYAQ